jgi:hypothetical protein
MRRPSRQWREDQLGATLRAGLRPIRSAEPPAELWSRICAEIQDRGAVHPRRATFQRATLLSVLLLLGVGLAGTGKQLSGQRVASGSTEWGYLPGAFEWERLSAAALSSDFIMPPDPRPIPQGPPREAFNKAAWWTGPRLPTGGSVDPVDTILGQ